MLKSLSQPIQSLDQSDRLIDVETSANKTQAKERMRMKNEEEGKRIEENVSPFSSESTAGLDVPLSFLDLVEGEMF